MNRIVKAIDTCYTEEEDSNINEEKETNIKEDDKNNVGGQIKKYKIL